MGGSPRLASEAGQQVPAAKGFDLPAPPRAETPRRASARGANSNCCSPLGCWRWCRASTPMSKRFRAAVTSIAPLAGALLGLAGVHLTGHHYQSHRDGTKVVLAGTEAIGGRVDDSVLDALAEVAVWLPKP
ncbi:hypothetical protein [Amycolatopsis silviterrae]|uniref:Uncharacterized protein n=1 Tax=Amycolatopsis silviterrae TaxID=1656914 RepID=A0ABW5HPC8_9PSEU